MIFHIKVLVQHLMFYCLSDNRGASKVSFQFFRLKRRFSETFSEEVLGSVTASVASITSDWNNNFLIWFVFGEYFLEAITEVEEVVSLGYLAFKQFWLNIKFCESGSHPLLNSRSCHNSAVISLMTSSTIGFETAVIQSLRVAQAELAIGSESVQWVVILGKSAPLMFKADSVG